MTQNGEFIWDGTLWTTQLHFADWQGYTLAQTMGYPASYASEGLCLSLDSGDLDTPPSERDHEWLSWIQAHQTGIQTAMLKALFKQYPDFKAEALEWYDEEDEPRLAVMLPDVKDIEALKRLVNPRNLMLVRASGGLKKPLFAIGVDCSWDDQGLGVLMYGEKVIEAAETEVIFNPYDLYEQVQELERANEQK